MKYSNVKNPQWMDAKHTMLNVLVLFEGFPSEIEFTTQADYDMPHGVDIFKRAVAGDFGEIAAYAQPEVSIEQAHTAKLAEIVNGSNTAIDAVKSQFSQVEAASWALQEAGARIISDDEGNVKSDQAALLLSHPTTREIAVATVERLASMDGAKPQIFAQRIILNADHAAQMQALIWEAQNRFKKALRDAKAAGDVNAILAIDVKYSVSSTI